MEILINEVNTTHRYSMSRIYNLYNEVFEKSETPQSCASCLIKKIKELQAWLEKTKDANVTVSDDILRMDSKSASTAKKRRKNGSSKA
ncbi:hypothetical protein LJC00_03150 [Dysgonomonas sp. OttesenSCG-928-M03]|nr:hypothetical protein [Dysgonomonas sp. OttesenSCG-928-M03]